MQRFPKKEVRKLIIWFSVINLVLIASVFLVTSVFEVEELRKSISILDFLLDQVVLSFIIIGGEIILLSILFRHFFSNRTPQLFSLKDLLENKENPSLEFKSTLRWDLVNKTIAKHLEYAVAKSIAAFLNTDGGTLLIGVDDNGKPLGLDADYKTLKKNNSDALLVHLSQLINKYIGKSSNNFIEYDIESLDGVDVCRVDVLPSSHPVFLRDGNNEALFIRSGASAHPLSISDAHEYIESHWA